MKYLVGFVAVLVLALTGVVHAQVYATQVAKVNICHATSSESHPWEAIRIDMSAWPAHQQNHGDFLYGGPTKQNGHPVDAKGQDDAWCEANAPVDEPEEEPEQEPEKEPETPVTPTVVVTPVTTPVQTWGK